jgi:ankyrin repeat protein
MDAALRALGVPPERQALALATAAVAALVALIIMVLLPRWRKAAAVGRPLREAAQLQQEIASLEATMLANPALSVAMAPGLAQLKEKLADLKEKLALAQHEAEEKLALPQQEAALRAQVAQLEQTAQTSPDLAATMAPALTVARAQLAALEARGGLTDTELKADPSRKAAVSKAEVEAIKAARATLRPAAARDKGEQLLEACMRKDAAAAHQLISAGADLDCVDEKSCSPLMPACMHVELDGIAARLIAAGAKLDLVTKRGNSALIIACNEKRAATALLLLEAGAALNQVAINGKSALDYSDERNLATVSAAIRARGGLTGAEVAEAAEAARAKGEQLLAACTNKDAAAALRLIGEGAALNQVVSDVGKCVLDYADEYGLEAVSAAIRARGGRTSGEVAKAARAALGPAAAREKGKQLRHACECSNAVVALRLISEGADLDCVDVGGFSPLIIASREEELKSVAALLVAAGAQMDIVDRFDRSALIWACDEVRAATALMLVESGAALSQIDRHGNSALDYADEKGLAAVSAAFRARGGRTGSELVKAARAALGPAAARAKGEQLLAACTACTVEDSEDSEDSDAALRLISEGADPDCVDENGNSPLIVASCKETLDGVAARLIAAGAKLNRVNNDGNSALILACASKRYTTAELLVKAGAALNHVNSGGKSALDWAKKDMCLFGTAESIRARGGRTGAELKAFKAGK